MRARRKIPPAARAAGLVVAAVLVAVSPALGQSAGRSLFELPPIESFSETVERPLFLPDRRPPAIEETQEGADDVESGLFTLVGIIVSPTQRIALVKVRGSQTVLQLSEGQQANGWTVLQIRPEEVIFELNDKTETIELIDIRPPLDARRRASAGPGRKIPGGKTPGHGRTNKNSAATPVTHRLTVKQSDRIKPSGAGNNLKI